MLDRGELGSREIGSDAVGDTEAFSSYEFPGDGDSHRVTGGHALPPDGRVLHHVALVVKNRGIRADDPHRALRRKQLHGLTRTEIPQVEHPHLDRHPMGGVSDIHLSSPLRVCYRHCR